MMEISARILPPRIGFSLPGLRPLQMFWMVYSEQTHSYCHFLLSDVPTMPIVDKLKEALKPGRKETSDEGDLNKLLASSAKKVLLQKIEFEPASKGFSYQLDSLKNKYVILNPRNEGATCQKPAEPAQIKRQGLCSINLKKDNGSPRFKPNLIRIVSVFKSQKMWLGVRVMASPPLRRCCFQGTNLP